MFVLHDAIQVRLWAVFAVRRLHHAIQAFESIDLLGIAQLGCIGEIRTNGELRGGVNAPSVTHGLRTVFPVEMCELSELSPRMRWSLSP